MTPCDLVLSRTHGNGPSSPELNGHRFGLTAIQQSRLGVGGFVTKGAMCRLLLNFNMWYGSSYFPTQTPKPTSTHQGYTSSLHQISGCFGIILCCAKFESTNIRVGLLQNCHQISPEISGSNRKMRKQKNMSFFLLETIYILEG